MIVKEIAAGTYVAVTHFVWKIFLNTFGNFSEGLELF